jgi:hypothetical protein
MARRILVCILLAFIFVVGDTSIASGMRAPQQENKPSPASPFRYAIVWNKVIEGNTYPFGTPFRFRGVDVLMDEKSFSEANLRQLLQLLSKRFPDPERLQVDVYTNLEDVLTPEEAELVPPPGSRVPERGLKHAWAFYIRSGDNEHLDYCTKEPGAEVKTVTWNDKKK